jgi:hypothetical protein
MVVIPLKQIHLTIFKLVEAAGLSAFTAYVSDPAPAREY